MVAAEVFCVYTELILNGNELSGPILSTAGLELNLTIRVIIITKLMNELVPTSSSSASDAQEKKEEEAATFNDLFG